MMTKIEELKAAYDAATPGEWRIGDAGATVFGPKTDTPSPETVAGVRKKANAEFITLAHNMMPQLLLAAAGPKEFVKQVADDTEDGEIEPELIKDGDGPDPGYTMPKGMTSCWITVDGFAVYLVRHNEGSVSAAIYQNGKEMEDEICRTEANPNDLEG